VTVTILKGDCRDVLATLPDESVHCVVTSPPYFGLRDYGMAGQIGLEPSPSVFVDEMVGVFRESRRVLRSDGTLWLNLGDSYCPENRGENAKPRAFEGYAPQLQGGHFHADIPTRKAVIHGVKQDGIKRKDLMGIPWRVAFALQADGWYLRQDIIWSKPTRCRRACATDARRRTSTCSC
jgi:DNA modification methylase